MSVPIVNPAVVPAQQVVQQPVVAQPVAVQPVVAVAQPVPANVSVIFGTPQQGAAVAAPGVVAVPPEAVVANPEGPAPYKVMNPIVVQSIVGSGHPYFVSILNGKNTNFQISY